MGIHLNQAIFWIRWIEVEVKRKRHRVIGVDGHAAPVIPCRGPLLKKIVHAIGRRPQ